MRKRLLPFVYRLLASFWFVPGSFVAASLVLAAVLVWLDWLALQAGHMSWLPWLDFRIADPSGARLLFSTLAGSSITVTGLVFSITMVVLNMAAAQLGPRLLPNFLNHTGTQVVLGAFVGTFAYSLAVLAVLAEESQRRFVPQSAVLAGVLLGLASALLLIYFIRHVAHFVQAARVIDGVAANLEHAVRASFPERSADPRAPTPDEEAEHDEARKRFEERSAGTDWVEFDHSGYVQAVDSDALVTTACRADVIIRLDCRPGHFVAQGRAIATVRPADRVDEALEAAVRSAILTGPQRTSVQDPEFAVQQLVEIALRALSPGTNDPFTAINAIDRLGAALGVLARRELPSRYLRDAAGKVRVIADPYTYGGVVEAAFNQMRQAGFDKAAVVIRLLEVIATLARDPQLPQPFREALEDQVRSIDEATRDVFRARADRVALEESLERAREALHKGE